MIRWKFFFQKSPLSSESLYLTGVQIFIYSQELSQQISQLWLSFFPFPFFQQGEGIAEGNILQQADWRKSWCPASHSIVKWEVPENLYFGSFLLNVVQREPWCTPIAVKEVMLWLIQRGMWGKTGLFPPNLWGRKTVITKEMECHPP